ncbi:MAG: DUF2076 domain-containing protein [Caulobacteraceae bacterium]|nr:DUF2076 domain-containing protein [Caulobacteraceae bacterium]
MTPDERALLTRFLDDLAQVRGVAKDPEAQALIDRAVANQPDAAYLLVQHSLLADQALHTAQERIADLEGQLRAPQPAAPVSFLGGQGPAPGYSSGGYPAQTAVPPTAAPGFFGGGAPAAPGGFGSFLRNVGTTAAGVAGGEFLFEGLSNLLGGHRGGGGGGFFGGGYGQPVENVTINNYGDDSGGGDWSDDNSYGDDSDYS